MAEEVRCRVCGAVAASVICARCLEERCLVFVLEQVAREYWRGWQVQGPISSAHEGYAVLLEEMDELKGEVWKKPSDRSVGRMAAECTQIAMVAVRFWIDGCREAFPEWLEDEA